MKVYPVRALTYPRARTSSEGAGTTELAVEGLVCSVCAARVRDSLERVPGVDTVQVDLASGRATVRHRVPVSAAALEAAVQRPVVLPWARRLLAAAARSAGPLVRRRAA